MERACQSILSLLLLLNQRMEELKYLQSYNIGPKGGSKLWVNCLVACTCVGFPREREVDYIHKIHNHFFHWRPSKGTTLEQKEIKANQQC
jgi:hypothetical protein